MGGLFLETAIKGWPICEQSANLLVSSSDQGGLTQPFCLALMCNICGVRCCRQSAQSTICEDVLPLWSVAALTFQADSLTLCMPLQASRGHLMDHGKAPERPCHLPGSLSRRARP